MSLSTENKNVLKKEANIGRKAAKMVTDQVQKNVKSTFDIKNQGGEFDGKQIPPILKATKAKSKVGENRLLGIDITSNRYAFIHHFGFTGDRQSSFIKFQHPRFHKEFTERQSHPFILKSRSIFTDVFKNSGVRPFLVKELSQTRSEFFLNQFNDYISKLSPDE